MLISSSSSSSLVKQLHPLFLRASCCSCLWSSYLPPRSLYKGSRLATESTEIFKTDLKGLSSRSWQDAVHGYCLSRCTHKSTPFHLCNESFDHRMWNVHCVCSAANRFSLERSQCLCLSLALCDNRISRDVKCESPLRCKQTRSQLVAAHRLPCSEDLSSVHPAAKTPAAVEQRRPGCSALFQPVGAGFKWPVGRLRHSSNSAALLPSSFLRFIAELDDTHWQCVSAGQTRVWTPTSAAKASKKFIGMVEKNVYSSSGHNVNSSNLC